MRKINNISQDPKQKITVPLENGNSFTMSIFYSPRRMCWFIKELSYNDFILRGYRIYNSDNILHQFRNRVPFGLACYSVNSIDPKLIDDFELENSSLYLLDSSEVERYTRFLSGQV